MAKLWNEARKTITAAVTGGIGWATVVIQSPQTQITASEWLMLATIVAMTLGVYKVSNEPAA